MPLRYYAVFIAFLTISYTSAQVGIGTNTPVTELDIEARASLSTGEFNGILIPRVTSIPGTVGPAGTLIYVTAGTTPGFYYSNGSAYVNVSSASGAFLESGTTNVASNETQNSFRTGQTSIGEDFTGPQFHVGSIAAVGSPRTTIGVRNLNTSTANVSTFSLDLSNFSLTTATKYGIRNNVSSSGIGDHIGIENTVFDSGTAATSVTGIFNDVGATSGVSSVNYGIRSEIGSSASRGTNYAIYAYAQHGTTTSDPSYSGYFRGDRFAIRNEDDSDGYDMPTVDGAAGQVLTTDGSGNVSWSNSTSSKSIVRAHIGTLWQATTGSSNPGDYLVMEFDAETIDTKNEYDPSSYTFTALVTGYYKVNVQVSSNDYDGDSTHGLAIFKGLTMAAQDVRRHTNIGFTSEDNINRSLSDIIQLNAGETIQIRFNDNFATFGASSEKNYFTIEQL